MDDLNLNSPRLREYISLMRLKMLTPLSLLINIAVVVICTFVPTPSLGILLSVISVPIVDQHIAAISKIHPTAISPKPIIIAVYVLAIFIGQLAYCIFLDLARKQETKRTLTSKGIGFSLILANWAMALWSVAWVFEWFRSSAVLQGFLLLVLLYANIMLLSFHPPTWERPFDMLLIHAPLRFFLVLELALMFPLSLFIALGLEYTPCTPDQPVDYSTTSWPAFGVVLGTNLLGLVVIVLRRDIVWSIAATWISISLWSLQPKPASVFITAVLFTILHPLVLLTIYIYSAVTKSGQVALPPDDNHSGLYISANERDANNHTQGPREVDETDVWG